jgi:hypothetical protein
MNGQLTNIPTNSLIEMLFVILTPEFTPTPYDGSELEQIQHELQRRGDAQNWSFATVN